MDRDELRNDKKFYEAEHFYLTEDDLRLLTDALMVYQEFTEAMVLEKQMPAGQGILQKEKIRELLGFLQTMNQASIGNLA